MAFCTNCGSALNGPFCTNCGQPQSGAAQQPDVPFAGQPVSAPPMAPSSPPRRKLWPYALFGCLGLLILTVGGMVATGIFVAKKVADAGIDTELFQKNPVAAVSKLIATFNPDVEVIDVNEGRGIVTVRDKKTGKVVTLNFEDVKQGRIILEEDGKGKVEINSQGEQVRITSPEGTAEIGSAKLTLPDWLPPYRSVDTVALNITSPKGGTVSFTSPDSPAAVSQFYQDALKKAGLSVNVTTINQSGKQDSVVLVGEGGGRSAQATIAADDEGKTQVTLMYGTK